jgi:hypothetical protein
MKISKPIGYSLAGFLALSLSCLLYFGVNFGAHDPTEQIKPKLSENLRSFNKPDVAKNQALSTYRDEKLSTKNFRIFKSVVSIIDPASIVEFQLSNNELNSIESSVFEFRALVNEMLKNRAVVEKFGSDRLVKIEGNAVIAEQLRIRFESIMEAKIGKTRWDELKTGMPIKSIETILDHWGKYPVVFRVEPTVEVTEEYSTVEIEKTTGEQAVRLNYTYGLPDLRVVYGDFASVLIGRG